MRIPSQQCGRYFPIFLFYWGKKALSAQIRQASVKGGGSFPPLLAKSPASERPRRTVSRANRGCGYELKRTAKAEGQRLRAAVAKPRQWAAAGAAACTARFFPACFARSGPPSRPLPSAIRRTAALRSCTWGRERPLSVPGPQAERMGAFSFWSAVRQAVLSAFPYGPPAPLKTAAVSVPWCNQSFSISTPKVHRPARLQPSQNPPERAKSAPAPLPLPNPKNGSDAPRSTPSLPSAARVLQ